MMDANSIFRIIVGVLLILGGIGWAVLCAFAEAMSDTSHDNSENGPIFVGLGVAAIGVVVLALPLFFH